MFILLITLMNIISPALAAKTGASDEVKAFGIMFVKISLGVVLSSLIIAIGLWLYNLTRKSQEQRSIDSKAQQYTCEIDDTKTIAEAIKTFLTINN